MPDFTDRVQDATELFQRQALENARRRPAQTPSRETCRDCEEPIPAARREKQPGCQRCVDCQTLHENWRPT